MVAMTAAWLDTSSVEVLDARLQRLVLERQLLRSEGAGRASLERNRQEICRLQHALSLALIARHQPSV
jgi:hypothetical protein